MYLCVAFVCFVTQHIWLEYRVLVMTVSQRDVFFNSNSSPAEAEGQLRDCAERQVRWADYPMDSDREDDYLQLDDYL